MNFKRLWLAIFVLLSYITCSSQSCDSVTLSKVQRLQKQYISQIKNPMGYMSGVVYTRQYLNFSNNQFYGNGQWQPCVLFHNVEQTECQRVRYDIYNDELVTLLFTTEGSKFIKLNHEYVSAFEIDGHRFDFIYFANPQSKSITPKYYEILVKGRYSVYKSWQKMMSRATENSYGHFDDFYRYIVVVDGKAYEVNNRKDLQNVFRQSEIETFLSTTNLSFENFESDLLSMVYKLNQK